MEDHKDGVKIDVEDMLKDMLPMEPEEPPQEPPQEPPVEPPAEPPVEPPVEPPKEPEEPPKEPEVPPEEPPKEPEEPPKEPPKEPEPVKLTAEQELEQERERTRLLLERVEAMSDPTRLAEIMRTREPVVEPAPEPKPGERAPVVEPVPVVVPEPAKPTNFLEGKELADVVDSVEGLNALLNRVKDEAAGANVDVVVEKILTAIPNLVAGQIVQQNAINKMVGEFYEANKDLAPAKRTVGIFVNEVHSEHPDWKTEDVFKEAGTRTRKALGLRESASPTPTKSPAFAKQRGSHKRGGDDVQLEGLAKEIDDLISD